MQSGISSFERKFFYPALWKKNMARFWPIWLVYGVGWLLALPLNLLLQDMNNSRGEISALWYFSKITVRQTAAKPSTIVIFCFSILAAMAVFSYLYNSRSTGFLHALPVRREGLFLTNYLSGLSFLLLPAVVVFVVTLLAELAKGCLDAGALGLWLLMQVLLTLFFYSFAAFCAMFTGHILALPAFYGILNGLAYGMLNVINAVLSEFVFGYQSADLLERMGNWLSPMVLLYQRLNVQQMWGDQGGLQGAQLRGLGYALVYAAVGLLLAVAALLIYRRRNLESAGDVVAVPWVRPVFKYGVAFCAAMTVGLFLYQFFNFGSSGGVWSLLVCLLLGGCIGYFSAEMLLRKSFLIFRKSWKGWLSFSLAVTLLIVGMELDVIGFESRVPAAEKVLSVAVTNVRSAPYDSAQFVSLEGQDNDTIQAVLALHESIVKNRKAYENRNDIQISISQSQNLADGVLQNVETKSWVNFTLRYELLGGGTLTRAYSIPVSDALLADTDSPAARLTALINRPEHTLSAYFNTELLTRKTSNISVNLLNPSTGNYDSYPVPAEYREALMDAVKTDMAAGRLGRRYLLDDMERLTTCYYNDLSVEFVPVEVQGATENASLTITLQTTAEKTLAVLQQAGVVNADHVLETRSQQSIRTSEDNLEKNYYTFGDATVKGY